MTSIDSGEAQKQIQNMVRFIEQEAREKADELTEQTNQELQAWKSEFIYTKRVEFRTMMLDLKKRKEVEGKIAESKLKQREETKILVERLKIMQSLQKESMEKLKSTKKSKANAYKSLLEDLIVEGLLKMMERKVTVRACKDDQEIVKSLLSKAKKRFEDEMIAACAKENSKFNMNINISMDSTPLPDRCIGGVWIQSSAYLSRPDAIIVRNSFDARNEAVMQMLTPMMREIMFPEDEERRKEIEISRKAALEKLEH
eukprot:CAMPEP_0114507038 /NCGR_PEP_ID=MMETSP0109-20121206/11783_1 /TAXON_ID=29199 /ORGANISM="Chlorarachnion reptans, Strain CCCM449" /LENGTH=256 /DNA_ID=CAMNT_0001685737 /DNA_START=24 /DNA_END=794 /DNA_ORIENTATION=+